MYCFICRFLSFRTTSIIYCFICKLMCSRDPSRRSKCHRVASLGCTGGLHDNNSTRGCPRTPTIHVKSMAIPGVAPETPTIHGYSGLVGCPLFYSLSRWPAGDAGGGGPRPRYEQHVAGGKIAGGVPKKWAHARGRHGAIRSAGEHAVEAWGVSTLISAPRHDIGHSQY